MKIYIVQKGDTASEIATKHGVSLSALKKLNTQLNDPEKLKPGMKIKVPTESKPVLRKAKVVKKETSDEQVVTNELSQDGEEDEEISASQAFSGNKYTYKIPQEPGALYPFSEGEEGIESTIPMMDDLYPNAIKEKTENNPTHYYGHPSQGGYPNVNSYTNPYYYPQNAPAYYTPPTYPASKEAQQAGYGVSPGMPAGPSTSGSAYPQSAPQSYGFYGYAPPNYNPGMRANPLGCRAEETYSGYYPEAAYGSYELETSQMSENPSYEREMTSPPYNLGQMDVQGTSPYYGAGPHEWHDGTTGSSPNTGQQPQGWPGEAQTGYPYTGQQPQGWPGEAQMGYPYTGQQPQGWSDEAQMGYPYTGQQPQGWSGEAQTGYPYTGQQPQGWPGEAQTGYPYTGQQPQGWAGETQGGYPYTSHQQHGGQPYPYAPASHQGSPGAHGIGTSPQQAPDYSLWESYVDYHVPPYQPDFPVKPQKD